MYVTVPNIRNAHDPETRNIINRTIDVTNELGKRIQDLVAKGQLTPEQYAELIQSVNGLISKGHVTFDDIDINKGKLLPKHASEELLRMITGDAPVNAVPADGSLTTRKYANKSVTENKTTFFKPSKNLFSGVYEDITVTTSSYRKNTTSDNGKTAVISIEPNTDYTIKSHGANDSFRIGVLNTALPSTLPTSNVLLDRVVIVSDGLEQYTFRNNSTGKTLLFMASYEGKEPRIQIEKGTAATSYEAPYVLPAESVEKTQIEDGSVTPEMTSFMLPRNLFSGDYQVGIVAMENIHDMSTMYSRDSFSPYDGRVAVIPVRPDRNYTFRVLESASNLSNVMRIGFTNSQPTFTANRHYLSGVIADNDGVPKQGTVKSKSDSRFMVIYLSNDGSEPGLIVSEGSEAIDGGVYLPADYLPSGIGSSGGSTTTVEFMPIGEFSNNHQTSTEISTWDINPDTITLNQFYQLHENLRSAHPNYINRKIIGYAGTSTRQDDTSLPIYEYSFVERMADSDVEQNKPVLLVQSLIHGNERLSGYNAYLFFKDLCERRNADYDYIRDNFHIKYLAVASPYSYLNNQRKTAAGVDPNRNFDSDWSYVPDDGSPSGLFPGDKPMSEKETQYIDQWLSDNKNAIGLIDIHNTSGSKVTSQGQVSMCWIISRDRQVKKMAQMMLTSLSRKWRKEIPDLSKLPANTNFGYVNSTISGTTRNQAFVKYGIPSITIDPTWTWQYVQDSSGNKVVTNAVKNDKNASLVSNDIVGSTIFSFIKWFS